MSQERVTIQDTLKILVDSKRYAALKDILLTMNPADVSVILESLTNEQITILFRLLPRDFAGDVFTEMSSGTQQQLILGFSDSELKHVIDELYVDDAADLVEEMPANVASRILAQAEPEKRELINQILKYPQNSAGTVMTTEMIELDKSMTVIQALNHIREVGVDKETIYTCYITEKGSLIGIVSVKDLIITKDQETRISVLMEENYVSVNTTTDREKVAQVFKKYDLLALPVTDAENRLAGIITFDDVMDVIEQETTEDITIMSGQTPYEKTYKQSSSWDLYLHRIPWLLILMVSATFTGMIITNFENSLATCVVLTAFIPMLMDTGGNSGSQSSVTIIRALSLGEIDSSDLLSVIGKEILTALLCGISLALVCFGKVMLIDRLLLNNPDVTVSVALTVCLTMSLTVVVAKIVGCSLPIIAKTIGFDPAVMASPFITTIVDALSLLVYFTIASAVLL